MSTPTPPTIPLAASGEVIIGFVQGFDEDKHPEVSYFFQDETFVATAMSTIPVTQEHMGRNAVLSFVDGNLNRPIIIGFLWHPGSDTDLTAELTADEPHSIDNNIAIIKAKDHVELACGKSRLIMRKNGEIYLRGTRISTEASETFKIDGRNVKIN